MVGFLLSKQRKDDDPDKKTCRERTRTHARGRARKHTHKQTTGNVQNEIVSLSSVENLLISICNDVGVQINQNTNKLMANT